MADRTGMQRRESSPDSPTLRSCSPGAWAIGPIPVIISVLPSASTLAPRDLATCSAASLSSQGE